MTPQEFRERSLWRLLVSNEMGGKKMKKVLVPRQFQEKEKIYRQGTR